MNIETANRLYELRKKNGLSQEDLADKLGISRQAVSKWERAEASPDTDNLILLAKLYGVSLDELLNMETSAEFARENPEPKEEEPKEAQEETVYINKKEIHLTDDDGSGVHIDRNGITTIDHDGNVKFKSREDIRRERRNSVAGIISGVYLLCATIAYILLGVFLENGFQKFWVLFVAIPVVASLADCIAKRKLNHFAYAPFCALVFLSVGVFTGIWHPTWVIFISIPIYHMIATAIDHHIHGEKEEAAEVVE